MSPPATSMPLRADSRISVGSFERPIALWLLACCAMIFLMVVIGGITRLTESGLSITEWQPVTGVLPPLDAAQWEEEFAKYRAIPQYRAIHPEMTLEAFKGIFFWEYLHRLWGRLIGVVFAVPFLYFLLRRRLSRRLVPPLAVLFLLGGLQGALGWYMVESGLSARIEVSQYRLAAHLLAAAVIYGAMLWVALDLLAPAAEAPRGALLRRGLDAALALIALTLAAGAFVAGLRAGYLYNTFPLMAGGFAPAEYWQLAPWYRNWFENPAAAQFDHRLLAETTWLVVAALWLYGRRLDLARHACLALDALFAMATLQAGLGIATLLLVVPLPVAVAHQAGAILVLTAAVAARHALRSARAG
ncbi:MAG TPA: COX15/CtaA family protein [Stellaceae bacterium]|nr:COX15/CtaA family protein [Stellaceae bacterium]